MKRWIGLVLVLSLLLCGCGGGGGDGSGLVLAGVLGLGLVGVQVLADEVPAVDLQLVDVLLELGGLLAHALGDDEVAICSAPNDGCVAVVAVSRLLAQTLAQMPKAVVRSLLLLDTVAERGTVLTLYGGCLYVRYYDGGLRFAEVAEVANDADICYYLQRIDEVYNIYNIGVRITPENRGLAALCRRHFKRVICE